MHTHTTTTTTTTTSTNNFMPRLERPDMVQLVKTC